MKILVTGGAGFIASHIVDAYIAQNHSVTIVDDLSSGFDKNINPSARFIKKNICDGDLNIVFEDEKFDLVNHHAAQMDVRKSVADPIFDANTNIIGTLNILENCKNTGVKKVIFASTGGAIYGEQEYFPADENHNTSPVSPYGISKLTIEKYLNFYQLQHNLSYSILRYANVYGPRQNPFGEAGVVAIFANKLLKSEQPVINGNGEQTRDYVFVKDVVAANLLALDNDDNDTYNIGTGLETDVNKIFDILNKLTGSKQKQKHGPAAPGEQMRSVISYQKIKNKFNWEPSVSIEEGLIQTLEYFKDINRK